jgi:hypothetical protein
MQGRPIWRPHMFHLIALSLADKLGSTALVTVCHLAGLV